MYLLFAVQQVILRQYHEEYLQERRQAQVAKHAAANAIAIDRERAKHEAAMAKYGPGVEPWH